MTKKKEETLKQEYISPEIQEIVVPVQVIVRNTQPSKYIWGKYNTVVQYSDKHEETIVSSVIREVACVKAHKLIDELAIEKPLKIED